jgi:ferredoxin-thioredoxin reductase catalytic subunit
MITFEKVKMRAELDAKARGYFLTPDKNLLQDLLRGLMENEERYGYPVCPCRIGTGNFESDRDIICPCDYRDLDVLDFGMCYCSLFVNKSIFDEKKESSPFPERRPFEKLEASLGWNISESLETKRVKNGLFYCRQCGYVVFREEPPFLCPICRAKREFFEEINLKSS